MLNDVLVLMTWWAVWTLCDLYLIPFSPVPELSILALCAMIHAWNRYSCHQQATRLIDGVTHTSSSQTEDK